MNSLNRFADPVYCLMRLIAGLMFASHGGQLVLGMFGGMSGSNNAFTQTGGWIQLIGGFLIAFGLFTRISAFICSGEPLFSNKGELAIFYCWVFFFMVFYGPGRWSIDAMMGKGKASATTATA